MLFQMYYTQTSPFASKLGRLGQSFGIFDVIVPFLIVFALVFAVARSLPIFQKEKDKPNDKMASVIALIIGLLFLYPHFSGMSAQYDPVQIMMNVIPASAQVFVLLLLGLMTAGMVGFKSLGKGFVGYLVPLSFLLIVLIFANALGWLQNIPEPLRWLLNPELQDLLIILVVFFIIVSFVTGSNEKISEKGKPDSRILRKLNELYEQK